MNKYKYTLKFLIYMINNLNKIRLFLNHQWATKNLYSFAAPFLAKDLTWPVNALNFAAFLVLPVLFKLWWSTKS